MNLNLRLSGKRTSAKTKKPGGLYDWRNMKKRRQRDERAAPRPLKESLKGLGRARVRVKWVRRGQTTEGMFCTSSCTF